MRDLLRHYSEGVKEWIVTTGDCATCVRTSSYSLTEDVQLLNSALRQRGQGEISLQTVASDEWDSFCNSLSTMNGEAISRRNFFRGVASSISDTQTRNEKQYQLSPEELLQGNGLVPWHCTIDTERCSLCDACRKVCPTNAIHIDQQEGLFFVVDSTSCNGCSLCEDVCEQNAVCITSWEESSLRKIAVTYSQCTTCGVGYLSRPGTDKETCQICSTIDHRRNLFQTFS
jgi:NAD-dependent dihydropyrimidine dehydrogenase PreA subunit